MPAIITAVIGGLVVSIIVPFIQASYTLNKELSSKKVELFSSVNDAFVEYIYAREQLSMDVLLEEKR